MEEAILEDVEGQTHTCIICLKDNLQQETMCSTECSHLFCKECLDEWLDRGKKSCPVCRKTIQYFRNNDVDYRVVVHGGNPSSRNPSSRDTISRDMVQNIVRQNYNMRYMIFLMFVVMVFGFNAYTVLSNSYNQLNYQYINEQHNITMLRGALHQCCGEDGRVPVYILQKEDGLNMLRKCTISMAAYNRCFPQ